MALALILARVVLASIFGIAGVAKLADRGGSKRALTEFGLPRTLAVPLGSLLPLAELAVAVAILVPPFAWWGALSALALLLVFEAGIAINLTLGRTPNCHCFGQLHSRPVGWMTLIRNGVLAIVAGFLVWQGEDAVVGFSIPELRTWPLIEIFGFVTGAVILAVLAIEGWLLLNLLKQQGRLLLRIEALEASATNGDLQMPTVQPATGLPIGEMAPAFKLPDIHGRMFTLNSLRVGNRPLMLVFTDPDCEPCNALLPEIGQWQGDSKAALTLVVISRGKANANRGKVLEHGLTHVLLQRDREVAEAYKAIGTPAAILIQSDGMIGSGVALGADAIRDLVARLNGFPSAIRVPGPILGQGSDQASAPVLTIQVKKGERAPSFKRPDLGGNLVDLADFRGRQTLLLFWNPGCGFCMQMLNELQGWEAQAPMTAPALLVVSTGTVAANLAMGLHSPIALDHDFSVAAMFGATGTPSAVIIDAQGHIASNVGVGAQAVLALARSTMRQLGLDGSLLPAADKSAVG